MLGLVNALNELIYMGACLFVCLNSVWAHELNMHVYGFLLSFRFRVVLMILFQSALH